MNKLIASIFVLSGSASYGMLSTMTKLSYGAGFSTADIVGSSNFIACIIFWLCCFPQWKEMLSLPRKVIGALITSGCCTALTGVFYYLSLQSLSASFAVILLFQFTWIGIIFDWVYRKNKPSKQQWIAVSFILLGTFLAVGQVDFSQQGSITGIGLGILSAISYALFINFSGHVAIAIPTLIRNAWMVTGALILSFIIFPPQFLWNGSVQNGLWFWGGFMAIFGAVVPVYLFAKGVPTIGIGMAGIFGAIELPVVIIFSSYLLKEQTTLVQWLGVGIIFMGILISVGKQLKESVKDFRSSNKVVDSAIRKEVS